MRYVISVPDDLSGYETRPGDFNQALRMTLDTWLGPDWSIQGLGKGELTPAEEDLLDEFAARGNYRLMVKKEKE